MLPKKNRASTKEVETIFKEGRSIRSATLTFRFILADVSIPHISFIAPKNVSKLTVKRNLLRRKGYSALKKYFKHFPPGIIGAFVFKKYQDDIVILENEIKNILDKIN